ncbi:MAG: glycosyltransferase family 2 protein [Cellulomonadaceae bacterium]|nr:glycosyltransferase family 2 protein [Cellulomonadaceae bacterium]
MTLTPVMPARPKALPQHIASPSPFHTLGVITLAEAHPAGLLRPVSRAASAAAAAIVRFWLEPGEDVSIDVGGDLVLHLQSPSRPEARRRLLEISRDLVSEAVRTPDGPVQLEVGAGVVLRRGRGAENAARRHALTTLEHRDLIPRPDLPAGRILRRLRTPSGVATGAQVVVALLLTFLVPFAALVGAYEAGHDASRVVYLALVTILGVMAVMQWGEAIHAMAASRLPDAPSVAAPPASALIAAYLPNEAATIMETVEVFLGLEYSAPLQVVLAYNTPRPLPVEAELAALAQRDPRLVLLKVPGSTSKAQNINAALPTLTGEFVGIFDADHHPATGVFERAWRWIASGADVVQGHCVIRNGDDSLVAQTVATEFEQIYALSHPGRQRVHGFGVFGGSNGFWRAEVLRATRFRTDFLTEDIEASIRAVRDGRRIVNDPGLLSRELAPTTVSALWRQRMRWAQGWLQVAVRHAHGVVQPGALGIRQRIGLGILLLWREVFPWFSSLMWPLLAFFVWRDGGLAMGASIWWLTTAYTLASGPAQILVARHLAVPEIRRRTAWWWSYGLLGEILYTEAKNLVSRVAQLKQLVGEHHWVVTPRTAQVQASVAEVAR